MRETTKMAKLRLCHGLGLGAFLLTLGNVNHALAQVDAERFKPAVTHDGFVTAEGSAVRPTADRFEFGLVANYAYRPLVIANDNGDYQRGVVSNRLGLDLVGSATLVGPLALGVGLPVFFQGGGADPSTAGLGKLRIVPKIRLLDDRESIGLALALELRVPTHTGDFSGSDGFEFVPKAILDHRFGNGIRLGFNVGAVLRSDHQYLNINTGSEFAYAAAIGYRIGGNDGSTEVGLEAIGAVGLKESNREEIPLEALAYVKHSFSPEWTLFGGPGAGIIPGYGVPIFRLFAGVTYTPTSHDRDGDGVADDEDACPDIAEDRDADRDSDGCPEEPLDSDMDGVPDSEDLCPAAKETINGIDDNDGCPDTGDARVIYDDGKFTVLEAIHFETGQAQIKQESYGLLDQVALMIKANPDLHVRVEGHTDDTGPHETNMRLSEARAAAVKQHLVSKGVSPQRLSSKGYGPDKPLINETTPEARAKNRRVEFIVDD
jgi:outer membrane protein OmpA-like peptidoglycan-associated protein